MIDSSQQVTFWEKKSCLFVKHTLRYIYSVKFEYNYNNVSIMKCFWKCSLWNVGHFLFRPQCVLGNRAITGSAPDGARQPESHVEVRLIHGPCLVVISQCSCTTLMAYTWRWGCEKRLWKSLCCIKYTGILSFNQSLAYWGLKKMVTILQTTISNAFSWTEMIESWMRFHWKLFHRV